MAQLNLTITQKTLVQILAESQCFFSAITYLTWQYLVAMLVYVLFFLFLLRQTRQHIQRWLRPGMKLIDVCEHLEDTARTLVEASGLEAGECVCEWRGKRGRRGKKDMGEVSEEGVEWV